MIRVIRQKNGTDTLYTLHIQSTYKQRITGDAALTMNGKLTYAHRVARSRSTRMATEPLNLGKLILSWDVILIC